MTLSRASRRLAAALTTLAAGAAMAQSSPYYLGVAQSLGHESNLYRVGDGQVLPAGFSKSDTVSGTSLVGGVDQTIGRQRIYGSANLRANRYANNKTLDNESYGLNLALDWATVGRLSGTLSAAADQNLAQFNNRAVGAGVETKKNVVRTNQVDAKVRLGVVTKYTLEASLGHRDRSYSAPEYDSAEYRQTSGSLGLRYRPSGALSLGVALRITEASYPKFNQTAPGVYESDRLKRQDIDFTATWLPSAVSQFNLRLSPTHTSYDRDTGSDFSGVTGSATWGWQPTGKLKLTTGLSRDTGQSSDAVNLGFFGTGVTDYSRTTSALSLKADYELSAKIALNAGLSYAHRALTNTLSQGSTALDARTGSDNTTVLSLGARWLPTRSLQVGCNASAENRSSSNPALSVGLSGNSVSCYGQFVLQ
ncbi:MAG: outer membrane beta-barrel protein [Aquabacterium sp.]|nr:outer membrane beta-barrel protein [Aquabacterium sp.]